MTSAYGIYKRVTDYDPPRSFAFHWGDDHLA